MEILDRANDASAFEGEYQDESGEFDDQHGEFDDQAGELDGQDDEFDDGDEYSDLQRDLPRDSPRDLDELLRAEEAATRAAEGGDVDGGQSEDALTPKQRLAREFAEQACARIPRGFPRDRSRAGRSSLDLPFTIHCGAIAPEIPTPNAAPEVSLCAGSLCQLAVWSHKLLKSHLWHLKIHSLSVRIAPGRASLPLRGRRCCGGCEVGHSAELGHDRGGG